MKKTVKTLLDRFTYILCKLYRTKKIETTNMFMSTFNAYELTGTGDT